MIGGGGWGEEAYGPSMCGGKSLLLGPQAGTRDGLISPWGLARPVAPRVLSPSATNRAAMDSTTDAMTVTIQGMPNESDAVHETQRQQFMASVEVVWPS